MKAHGYASTVVLIRDSAQGVEVLLIQRRTDAVSLPGVWVFPGGRFGAPDLPVETAGESSDGDLVEAARAAGVREILEKTGLEIEAKDLVHHSWWVPPKETQRLRKTWFFIARSPSQKVRANTLNLDSHEWIAPRTALQREKDGVMVLLPPTRMTLRDLANVSTVKAALMRVSMRKPELYSAFRIDSKAPERGIAWVTVPKRP